MLDTVYTKQCPHCKEHKLFDNFYTGYATCKACYRKRHTRTLACLDCGAEADVYCPSVKKRENYRCQPCGCKHGILKSFEDPIKHQAWKDRTRAQVPKMRAAVKQFYIPGSGPDNPAWKGGLPNCTDCGIQLCDRAFTLCRACSYKRRRKPKNTCDDCHVLLEKRRSRRCQPCRVKFQRGKHAPMWKGGVTAPNRRERSTQQSRDWSKAVLKRDNYTCQLCKVRHGNLHAHHKKRWADHKALRFDVGNGVTLCRDCHLNVAHQGKWSNVPLNIWV